MVHRLPLRFSVLVISFVTFLLVSILTIQNAHSDQVALTWAPNPEPDLVGYRIYYGTSTRNYSFFIDVGNTTSYIAQGLEEGRPYYFAATAYDMAGNESDFSNEVVYPPKLKIWLEAEYGFVYAPMLIATDSEASSGQYIWVPEGYGPALDPSQGGYAEFFFEVPAAGQYLLWGRVLSSHGSNDSFFVSMDGGPFLLWDTQVSNQWVWDKVNNRDVADPVYFDLAPGVHTLLIQQREDGTKIDTLLLTNDLEYVPGEVKIMLEAESGVLHLPFQVAPDSEASSGQYIWVPEGYGPALDPLQGGNAEYVFEIPMLGRYVFWGRVLSSHGSNDSFFVSMDGGPFLLWDTQVSQSWTWDRVNNREVADPVYFDLAPGVHTLLIQQREDGTKIDTLLLTNDLKFVP